jgi:hypothetical protein
MDDIAAKIMVEILSTLALATKEVTQGRSSESVLADAWLYSLQHCNREIGEEDPWRKGYRGDTTNVRTTVAQRSSDHRSGNSQGSTLSRPGHK